MAYANELGLSLDASMTCRLFSRKWQISWSPNRNGGGDGNNLCWNGWGGELFGQGCSGTDSFVPTQLSSLGSNFSVTRSLEIENLATVLFLHEDCVHCVF